MIGIQNNFLGNSNEIRGISNSVYGDENIVKNGKFNTVIGNQNNVGEKSV